MKKAILAARVLLGAVFLIFGLNYYLKFIPIPPPENALAGSFIGTLFKSGFLEVVKIIEIVGGLLLLSGRFAPLGLALLAPIVIVILLYDIFLAGAFNPAGTLVLALSAFLAWAWRGNYLPLLQPPR